MAAAHKTCRACGGQFSSGELFCPVDGARLNDPASEAARGTDPLAGAVLGGRYRIVRPIGEGGMGIVYEAEHILIEKPVAVKVLREDFSRRPDVVARFRQEARSASRIGHTNIVDVSDFGETESGASYFVMEMLRGEDLADVLSREHALSPLRAVGILYQCCRALSAAHDKGIVHRDLKPENVFLVTRAEQPDFVKIVDFGVAKMSDIEALGGPGRKLTKTGMIFGTPEYMSPEQASGGSLDHRVDVYGLGVILYELVTGKVPFEGDNFMEILSKHASEEVPPLTQTNPGTRVSPELEAVILRALQKDPGGRFQSMLEMARALEQVPEMPAAVPRESNLPPSWSLVPPSDPATAVAAVALDSAETRELPRRSSRRPLWLGAAALAVVATVTAGLALLLRPSAEPGSLAAPAPVESAASVEEPPVAPREDPRAAIELDMADVQEVRASPPPAAEAPDSTGQVTVKIETRPEGARVRIAGMGLVCQATPCEVLVDQGKALSLTARRGKMFAITSLVAEESTRVHLALRQSRSKRRPSSDARRASDLKIPEEFR